jgi:dethiobiotin synthetase
MTALFIGGTDTGVGKTTVTVRLIEALRARGQSVAPYKPVETGCDIAADGALLPADARMLLAAAGGAITLDAVNTYAYRPPVTPLVAAREVGETIELERIRGAYDLLRAAHDVVLVEGCGGLLSPIGPGLDSLGLARALGLPLLLVARATLGTISQTLLAARVARAEGVPLLGVVLSRTSPEPPGPDDASNATVIEEVGGVRVFGVLEFGDEAESPTVVQVLDALGVARATP